MRFLILLALGTVIASVSSRTAPPPVIEECLSNKYPPPKNRTVPWLVVNLDLPPAQRWAVVAKVKGNEIRQLLVQFKSLIRNMTNSDILIKLVDNDLGPLADTLPQPYQDELRGMANATGIPLGEILLYNIFYEVFTVCTSVVAENNAGQLFHARNLDFGLFMGWDVKMQSWIITEYLRPAIVNIHFMKKGKVLYSATNFAGYVGILTAMKQGVFTLTMNERFNADGGYIGIIEWILGKRNAKWMGFLTREVMENAGSFEEAKQQLANTPMLAPAYFILGGNKSGEIAIITRARDKALDIWMPTASTHPWYLLETNYDHWKAPFVLDDRRTPANKCMQQKGRKAMGFPAIFDMLSSRPMLNKLTTYTALMQVNTGKMETYLQYCGAGCMPW